MKIALALNEMNIRGGTHKQACRLARYLQAKGMDIYFLSFIHDSETFYPITAPVKSLWQGQQSMKLTGAFFKKEWQRIHNSWKLFKQMDPATDVLNIHDQGFDFLILLTALFRPKIRMVWQVNDLPAAFQLGNMQQQKQGYDALLRLYFRWVARFPHAITVNVTKNQQRVKSQLHRDAHVFYCGIDHTSSSFKERHPHQPVRLVSTGIFFPYRNYESILAAMTLLKEKFGLESELTIMGSTKLDEVYAEKVRTLGLQQQLSLKILGEVSDEEMVKQYAKADIFLFLNVDQSWGLSIFEAMNHSLPVVVSKSVGATEVLPATSGATIVDPKNINEIAQVIQQLVSQPEHYAKQARACFDFSLSMHWDTSYSEKVAVLLRNE